MKVLLLDVDSRMANLALMKISAYHKSRGDEIALLRPRNGRGDPVPPPRARSVDLDPELVYVSCLFTWNREIADAHAARWTGVRTLKGGTGYDHGKPAKDRAYLPDEIEYAPPDYDLYGNDYALGFCLRGCNRKCQFCDVPLKEGRIDIRAYRPPASWVPDGFKKCALLDNDPALYPDELHSDIFEWFIETGVKCSITQGYDIRCVTPARAALLADLKPWDTNFQNRTLYTAWDYIGIEGFIRERIPMLLDAGFKGRQITCYMICGFPPAATAPDFCPWDGADLRGPHAADLHRFEVLWYEYGVYPFVMVYNNEKGDPWLRAFARYVDRKVFKACSWEDYDRKPKVSE